MKCPNCDGEMTPKGRNHTTKIGELTVTDSTGMVMTCRECGSVSLSQDELAAYERRAARLVLTTAHSVGGEALKFARKALGLRQREMADLLETSEQQVSRWEHQGEVDRRLRLAVAALLDVAERDQGGLAELGANESRTLEVISKAS